MAALGHAGSFGEGSESVAATGRLPWGSSGVTARGWLVQRPHPRRLVLHRVLRPAREEHLLYGKADVVEWLVRIGSSRALDRPVGRVLESEDRNGILQGVLAVRLL